VGKLRARPAGAEDLRFLDLMGRLPPDRRRIIGVLLRRVAAVEDSEGEIAALSMIEDISTILARPETTH